MLIHFDELLLSNVPTCVARSLLCGEPPMRQTVLSDYLPSLRSHWLFSAHGVSLHTGRDVNTESIVPRYM